MEIQSKSELEKKNFKKSQFRREAYQIFDFGTSLKVAKFWKAPTPYSQHGKFDQKNFCNTKPTKF